MIYTMSLCVHPFFEASSGSYGFVVANPESQTAAIIDAPLGVSDLEEINTHCADQMIDWIESHELTVRFLLDTHVHADRPSATAYLKTKFPEQNITVVVSHPELPRRPRSCRS